MVKDNAKAGPGNEPHYTWVDAFWSMDAELLAKTALNGQSEDPNSYRHALGEMLHSVLQARQLTESMKLTRWTRALVWATGALALMTGVLAVAAFLK